MVYLTRYNKNLQQEIELFFEKCFTDLGWKYEPDGRHADIVNIEDTYMKKGCMWCLFDEEQLIGTVAVRSFDENINAAELKRLYVLNEYQGKGYGGLLFETALRYAKENGYEKIFLDTRQDRAASLHLIRKFNFKETRRYNNNEYAELFFELNL